MSNIAFGTMGSVRRCHDTGRCAERGDGEEAHWTKSPVACNEFFMLECYM